MKNTILTSWNMMVKMIITQREESIKTIVTVKANKEKERIEVKQRTTDGVNFALWQDKLHVSNGGVSIFKSLIPNFKELSESAATVEKVFRTLDESILNDPNTYCICVGDGIKPRTGVIMKLNRKLNIISVDPLITSDPDFDVTCIPSKAEDIDWLQYINKPSYIIILAVHSHANLQELYEKLRLLYNVDCLVISVLCCSGFVQQINDTAIYDEKNMNIWTPSNRMMIWKTEKRTIVTEFLENPTKEIYLANKKKIRKVLTKMTDADHYYYLFKAGVTASIEKMLISATITDNQRVFELIRDKEIDPDKFLKHNDRDYLDHKMLGIGDSINLLPIIGKNSVFYSHLIEDVIEYYGERKTELKERVDSGVIKIRKTDTLALIEAVGKRNTGLLVILINLLNL